MTNITPITTSTHSTQTPSTFLKNHLTPNLPLLLKGDDITSNWGTSKWVQHDGRPDLTYFEHHFGDCDVTVVADDGDDCKTVKFSDYIDDWNCKKSGLGYMKDWHYVTSANKKHLSIFYITPDIFADDWLNSTSSNSDVDADADADADDYRFVYIGPFNSSTKCHHDVLNSYSWSVNIAGSKRWILFPPSSTSALFSNDGKESLVEDVRDGYYDESVYPWIVGVEKYDFTQSTNELVFVPSGWYHCVYNTAPGGTLSINHNFINISSILSTLAFLSTELSNIRDLLAHDQESFKITDKDDERAWERQCERIMKANSGMNITIFLELLLSKCDAPLYDGSMSVINTCEVFIECFVKLGKKDVAEHCFYVDGEGGVEGERSFMKQVIERLESRIRVCRGEEEKKRETE